jgi:hypothetical protein
MAGYNFRHTRTFGLWLLRLTKPILISGPSNPLEGRKRFYNVAHVDIGDRSSGQA